MRHLLFLGILERVAALAVLLLILFSLNHAFAAPATPKYVQGNYADPQTSPTAVTVKYTLAQNVGDLNVVIVGWNDATAVIRSVTDSKGNVYRLAVGPTVLSKTVSQAIYYAQNISAAAAGTNTRNGSVQPCRGIPGRSDSGI